MKGRNPGQRGPSAPGAANVVDSQPLAARDEERRAARLARQQAMQEAAERRRRARRVRRLAIISGVLLVVVGGSLAMYWRDANKPGEGVAQQPSPHLKPGYDPPKYLSDPPTSGPHLDRTAIWGVSTTPITKELAVHNLEDGGVIINYQPDLDQATVDRLTDVADSYDAHVLMAPYPGLSHPIVLTAWGRIDRLEVMDEARMRRFIDAFRGIDHHGQSGS